MGLISATITLSNPTRNDLEPVIADALVDTGSVFLVIPDHIRIQLRLDSQSTKEVTLADGSKRVAPYVGPIEARFKNRVA